MNDVLISNYKSSLRSLFNSDEFANLDSSKIGVAVNSLNNDFRSAFQDIGSEEEASINTISDEMLTEYKNKAEIPRFIPKPEEFELYYGSQAPDLSTAKNAEDKIAIIDKWKEDGLKKSSDLIPSQTDDFKTHLDYLSNSFIRQAVSDDNKTGWLSDKGYRAVEGAMSMVTPFIPGADRFLAENLPENTGMDEDISSLLFSGAGQLVSQAAIALGASAVAGPEAGVAAIGTIYSARALVEGYKEEMRKSGNPDKALDVGLAGIPGAQLETFADSFLLGMFGGHGGKIAFEAFQKATTRAAKEAVIKAAIPSLGKKALQAGLVEASVGAAGADFTTGYGRYLASGDESYIPTAEQLAKGALVEGLLGAGYTSVFNGPNTEISSVAKDLKTFSQDKANADEIFKALKSKNYDLAVELATKNYANQPEKKTEASKIISDGIKAPSDEAKEKATSPILPNHRLVLKTKLKELEKAGDTESAKRISDTLKSVNDGSFTAPESFGLESVASNFEPTDTPVSVGDGNTVTLKDGTEVESDESLIYVKGISTSSAIVHNVTNNGVGILLDGSDKASLVFGNKTKTGGFSFSQTPKVGYTAVKVNGVHGDSKGKFIVSNFSILGEVAGAKKSEAAKQKTQAVVDKYKNVPQDQQKVEYKDSGINDALLVLDTLIATETLSDAGYAEVEKTVLDTLEKLEIYANNNPSEASGVEDIQNELWDAIPQFKAKVKEVGPTLPVRKNVDLFQQRIAEQAKLEQQELEIPVQVKDLAGRYVTYQGNGGLLNVSGGMAYVGDIEVSGSEALIQDVEGLSEVVAKKELPVKKEPIIEEEVPDNRVYKVKYDRYGAWKIFDDGSMKHIPRGKKQKVNKNTTIEIKPTVEAVVANPEVVFTSVVEDVVIESTIEDEVAPPVVTLDTLNAQLAKEEASLASVSSDKFKAKIQKNIEVIKSQIALLDSSGASNIPTAVQQIKEEIAVDKKEAEAAKKDEDVKISLSPKEDVDGGDVFDQVTFQRKPKLGIKKGQVAVSDVEVTNPRRGDENGYHIFSAGGKSYSVQYYSGFGNGVKKGWYLFNPETNETILIGNNKEEARTSLAKLINNKSPDVGNFVVQDKSNSEILKAVTFTPPKPESVEEKIERLNKAADDAANKVISDKVDAHIATLSDVAKAKWNESKDLIIKFFKATLTDPKNNRTEEFLSLGDVVLKRVEALASELDSKVANQIKKDQSERKTVSEQEKQHLKRVDEENARLKDVAKSVGIRYSISSSAPETSISQEEAQEYIDANGFNVNIEDTQEVTEDGHQWNGRVDFRSGTPVITVNIANISSVEQLRNVINEELGHVAYNVPQIAEILGKIKDTTKLRDEIKDLYKQSDLYEESVVKRMADLVDSYSEKGMFDKLVTAIKSYVKDKLGMELSDADLSYIAYRAINKASKVTKANKNIESKFSYAGEKAKMSQLMRDSLETAKVMATSGKTSEEIRAFTGWFPGKYDGKMRFEVPDNDIKINNEKFKELKVNDSFLMRLGIYEGGISLDQILEGNSKLLDTYPELKNVLIYRVDQYENASFNPGKNAIILPSNSKNSLLHEIQHFIQLKEGFSTGGNASAKFLVNAMSFDKFTSYFNIENMKSGEALMKVFNKLNALRLYKELDNKEKKAILDGDFGKGFDRVKGKNLINKLKDKYGISSSVVSIYDINSNGGVDSYYENESKVFSKLYEEVKEEAAKKLDQSPLSKNALYKSIAGEIESRDVENRSNLTDEQRKIIAPYSSENISKEDAIVMFNNNEESASVNTSTDLDGYTETPDIFSVLTNNITTEQRETFKKIQKMLRKKLEKKLIVDEPAAWSLLKSIKFGFLKQESLKAYNYLLDEFVRTRSKNRDPKSDVRDSAETVIAKASELAKEANQGHFDFLQMKHEFLEDKDFTNDYQGDIDLVMQLAKDDRGHKDSDLPSDKDGETLQTWQIRTLELQDLIFDNLDYVNDRLEEMFPSSNISTSNPILSKYLKVFQNNVDEVIAKQKEMFKSRMNQLMSDPTDKSYRDLRKQYFGLMDFLSDGYALNIEDFITQETADALATKLEDKDIMDMHKAPWRKKWLAGASSFYANTRMLGSKVADITSKLTNNFRSGIMAAERIHDEFTKPVLKEMYESAVAENGGKDFNGQEHNHAGIYSMARAFKSTEGVTEGILNSKRSIETSIKKDIESVWSGRKKAAENHLQFLQDLFVGITETTPNEEALGILEANAEKILPKGLISYVKGINELFEATKPLAKFTSEFGLGRPFEEWVNYTPSLAITKEGQPIEFDVTEMSVNVSSDESVHGDTNMQRGGGGSMKDRTRRLGNSMVYVFNINHLAENRMRLNLIDYLTLQQRRELNNVISGKGTKHKEFAKLLKDEDGGKERVSHLQTTVRTMWSNTIQSASFISEFQAGVNVFSNMWASGKLASLYQFPGQVASNLAPYFVVNSGSPKRIKYLFDAMGILLKKQMGQTLEPRLDKVVSRILSTVHGRSQEQFLDKSIALDVNGSAVWQQVKTSSFWNQIKGINRLREKILFSQFIYSDMMTGAPMMLANMMAHEEAAGRATSWDGLTFNDESFIKSVDEAERFVGIGASSRRGVWTNNKNGYLVTLRNMLSAFSSHRVNNATNFAIELAKVNDSNTTSEEKAQSVRYMLGIQAQSVVFSVIKWGMVGAFYNLLTASMGDEENEDELEKKYRKLLTDKNISKEQKLTIQAEISMLQKIRNEYEKVKEKNNSYEVLVVRGLQDMVSNSFLIPAATDIPVNAIIHNTYDKYEAERFNEVKESELKQLNEKLKKAKDSKNISAAIELQKDISRWESQEAITFVYEGQSIIPFDGVYGGVMKDAAKFVDSASSALLKAEPLSMADIFLGTGLVGLSQPELNKIARLYAKKEEHEQEYKEKIEEINKMPSKDRK